MNMRIAGSMGFGSWLSLTLWMLAHGARATAEAPHEYTLERAADEAVRHSPRVQSARMQLGVRRSFAAFGELPRVGNPRVQVRTMIGKPDDPAATYALGVGLPFDVAGTRSRHRNEARFQAQVGEAELASAINDARAEAQRAYVELVSAQTTREVAEENRAAAGKVLELTRARFDTQAATALDVALAERDAAEAAADVAAADRALASARSAFRGALGLRHDAEVRVAALGVPTLPAGVDASEALARGRTRRKEAEALRAGELRLRASERRLRAESVAPLEAFLEAERQGNSRPQRSVGASMSFELPFVSTNQGPRAVARAEAEALAVSADLADHAIAREITSAYESFTAAVAELEALEELAVPAAERAREMTAQLLEASAVDTFRLLSARREAFEVRARRVRASRDAWLLRVELERAVGGWGGEP